MSSYMKSCKQVMKNGLPLFFCHDRNLRIWFFNMALFAFGLLVAPTAWAQAATTYNATVTAINGTGNPDGFWNSYLDSGLDLQLSMKAQTTIIGTIPTSPNDGAGTFIFPTGTKPGSTKATWGYWFSINTNPSGTGSNNLSAYDFYLTFNTPDAPTTFSTPLNVLTYYPDNAYGNNSTTNSHGTIGNATTSPGLILTNNIAQNAENISFSGLPTNLEGDYDFYLYAVASGAGASGIRLARVEMIVDVVPEPASWTLVGVGLGGLWALRRKVT